MSHEKKKTPWSTSTVLDVIQKIYGVDRTWQDKPRIWKVKRPYSSTLIVILGFDNLRFLSTWNIIDYACSMTVRNVEAIFEN